MHVTKYETNFNKQIFYNETKLKIKKYPKRFEEKIIKIYPEITYQQIVGFGGAITESVGFSFSKLPQEKKENLINDYFSKEGLNYTLARVPIGSCDFSIKPYSYTSKRNLSDFSIEKDKQYIIPMLQKAKSVNQDLSLFASPWSPPWFMKNMLN